MQSVKKDGFSYGAVLKGKLFFINHRCCSVESQYNEGPRPRDWQNLFSIQGCIILRSFFIYFIVTGVLHENHSSYRGFHYVEVCYMEVLLLQVF